MKQLKKNNENKVLKLYDNIAVFFERAILLGDKGDYVGALDALYTAKRLAKPYSDDYIEVLLQIAECYSDMGLYRESNRILFDCLSYEPLLDDIYFGLIGNFSCMQQFDKVEFYANMGRYFEVFDEEYEPAIDELVNVNSKPSFSLAKNENNKLMLSLAKQFMENRDTYSFSKQIYTSLLESEDSALEAHSGLALIMFLDGNIDEGLKYCDEVLKKNPNDINALSQKCAALSSIGRIDEAQEILNKLDGFEIDNESDSFKLIMCAASVENNENIVRFASDLIKKIPYDKELLTVYSLACHNLGDFDKAEELALTRCRIYQNEIEGKYFIKLIRKAREENSKVSLCAMLDNNTTDELADSLNNAIKNTTPSKFAKELVSNDYLKDALDWAIREAPILSVNALNHLAKTKDGFHYINRALTDPKVSVLAKKQIFLNACISGEFSCINLVANDIFISFYPVIPKVSSKKNFTNAYFKAYTSMTFVSVNFDKKLNAAYRKLVKAFDVEGGKGECYDEDLLAAVLAFKANCSMVFSNPTHCCEVFQVEEEAFNELCASYDNLIKNNKKAKKTKGESDV